MEHQSHLPWSLHKKQLQSRNPDHCSLLVQYQAALIPAQAE